MIDLHATFEKFAEDFLRFESIQNKRSTAADVHAFLLLLELVPGDGDIVSASEHDEFFLSTNCDALAEVATEEHIRELVACGVMHSREYDCLSMFA
jgi:hypothetical protein